MNETIMFDYDDVLFHLIPLWVETLNNTHKTCVDPNDITDWKIEKFFPTLTKKQVFEPLYQYTFWKKIQPVKNGPECVSALIDNGFKIKVVTATHYCNVKPKVEMLLKYYPFLSWADVHITSDKQSIKGHALIDDNPQNLIGGGYKKILMNRSHNQGFDEDKDISRVDNIQEACDLIYKWFPNICKHYNQSNWETCMSCEHGYDDDGGIYCKINGCLT